MSHTLPVNYTKLKIHERREVREQYIVLQKGLCAFCKLSLTGPPHQKVLTAPINKALFPSHFFKYPVHLDHDHTTGMTRGAVHSLCNAVMWQYCGR